MSIFHDPTEMREGTRLPQSVIDASHSLPGLEQATGADLLVSPLVLPLREISDCVPVQKILRKHIDAGLLVQRKSGRDLVHSIPKLPEILYRMRAWTTRPWLLVVADIKADKDGQAVIDGHAAGWTFASVSGALTWWQLRGGFYDVLPRDTLIVGWLNGWLERLKTLNSADEYKIIHRIPQQVIVGPDWTDTLSTFPGVGADRAKRIAANTGRLADALCYLSHPTGWNHKIEGVGSRTLEMARCYLGLRENEYLNKVELNGTEKEETE